MVVLVLVLLIILTMTRSLKVIIVSGNGCNRPIRSCNWYGWMEDQLKESNLFDQVILENMPDPIEAKESIWVPHIVNKFGADENTIIIGHSSGETNCSTTNTHCSTTNTH